VARVPIVVDDREGPSGLAEELAARWPEVWVGRLPVGDVEIGRRILVERKTMPDLLASLADRRLFRQAADLSAAARPLLVLEGVEGLDPARVHPRQLRGVLLALTLGYRIPILRTGSPEETAAYLAQAAHQESRRDGAGPSAERNPGRRVALDVLGAIPGVGDYRARRLLRRFGSAGAVLSAPLRDLGEVPGIGPATARSVEDAGRRRS
jgi:ERCC4-type nuclease